MNRPAGIPQTGFHDGELTVQRLAGVRTDAARLIGMLDSPDLSGGIGRFLTACTSAAVTGRDDEGRLWVSPLVGPPGLFDVRDATTLSVRGTPPAGDPLHQLAAGQSVGLLAIDFARRRRVRVNGTLAESGVVGLTIEVEQAYGNCPQYIQQRTLEAAAVQTVPPTEHPRRGSELSLADAGLIQRADTFLLGTAHPTRGSDASHRGGPPGFVRVVDSRTLWWPDYPGNNMFNSLGNLAADPSAALLFFDFASGQTLRLSGEATLDWVAPGTAGDDGATGRRVRFTAAAVVGGPSLSLRTGAVTASPHSPTLAEA